MIFEYNSSIDQNPCTNKESDSVPDIITFGELLIDFVPTISNVSLIEAPAFKKAPGGAPANVAVGLARLGVSAGFMGKVGNDAFGHFLIGVLKDNHVDVSTIVFTDEARTALAFVSLGADGEREFMFYRHPSADMLFTPDEVDAQYIRAAKIFHFGSLCLITDPSRSATRRAIDVAVEADLLITYDPNLRINLWPDATSAKDGIMSVWVKANVIKISEDEFQFLSGESDLKQGADKLWHERLKLLIVTRGGEGCSYFTNKFYGSVPGFNIKPIDTTGAGDGFVAGLLKGLLESPESWENETILREICQYANAVGALTTTERGAIPALPTKQQVAKLLTGFQGNKNAT